MAASGCVESSSLCRRCKKVINGIKCQNCASCFHISCAKLSAKFCEDKSSIICCNVQNTVNPDTDEAFFEVFDEMASANKTVD